MQRTLVVVIRTATQTGHKNHDRFFALVQGNCGFVARITEPVEANCGAVFPNDQFSFGFWRARIQMDRVKDREEGHLEKVVEAEQIWRELKRANFGLLEESFHNFILFVVNALQAFALESRVDETDQGEQEDFISEGTPNE